jgi:transcriptional regulator GlxA family with amidase domain
VRVEPTARLLRETDLTCCRIATGGVCDRSHMIGSFRRILDRSPANVRAERAQFRHFPH